MNMISWLSVFAVLTAATYALLRSELRTAPTGFPALETGPASPPDGAHGVMPVRQAQGGEVVVACVQPDNAKVHEWARVARRVVAGERAQAAIAGARAGRETVAEAIRQAGLVAAIRAKCAEPIAHLEVDWRDATDSLKAFCGMGTA